MKEKTIEKIPYLGLQKISRKKSVKYIGVGRNAALYQTVMRIVKGGGVDGN